MTKFVLALLAIAALGLAYIRLAPMDPGTWHANPERGTRTGKPNDYLLGPGGDREALTSDLPPAELAARIDTVAMAEPRTNRLAGDPASGHVTYVQRSRAMGFPDAISVRTVPDGDGSRLMVWSRSRYGQSDLGVNAARVWRWLAAADLDAR